MERLRLCNQCLLKNKGECEVEKTTQAIKNNLIIPESERQKVIKEWRKWGKDSRDCPRVSPQEETSSKGVAAEEL